jgi:outer membrane protein assembly factor BamE
MRKILITTLVFASMALGSHGCSVYRIDIRQGNTLETETVDSLRLGMTKQQVVFLLGTPLIQDPFHPNRWDYAYSFQPGGGKMSRQHLSLFFEGDNLVKIDKSAFSAMPEKGATP